VKNTKYPTTLFIFLLFGIAYLYNYQEIIFKRPQSVHKWRQSDCASIALNYYQGGMRFFDIETHNLTSDGGTSGKCRTSEVPLLYYGVAVLYSLFGYHEFIYRILNTLLFLMGLFYLFKLLRYLISDIFWSVSLTLLFFTSPVLIYYGNNFLSNSSSLAFSIVGWYFFVRFLFEGKQKWYFLSVMIFLLAAAFKVTALFSLIAITGIYIIELLGISKFRDKERLFNKPFLFTIPIISVFILIGAWLFYAARFNKLHDCFYFSTTIFPIWNLDREGIIKVIDNIREIWLAQYFHISVLLFLSACFLFILIFFRKNRPVLIYSVLFIFAEAIVYVLLQFWTFRDHDYYVIDMFVLPVLIVVSSIDILKRHFNKVFISVPVKIVFSLFLLFNIYHGFRQINVRYSGWMNDKKENAELYSITPYLREIGVSPFDTVISIPDGSHVSLYLMNQKGWTEYSDARFNKGERVKYNGDSTGIGSSIKKGAKYLILNGINELYTKPYLQSFCTNLAGHRGNVWIFNLKSPEKNFTMPQRSIKKVYSCDAENLSSDGQNFVNNLDSTFFQGGSGRSETFAHGGRFSTVVDSKSPYGMTFRIKEIEEGESFVISVWRKAVGKSKGGLICSSAPNPFYQNAYSITETGQNGWEKLTMELTIPREISRQELGIYVYNPDTDTVYFDDLEITQYKSILK